MSLFSGISTAANDLGTEWLIVKGIEDFENDSQSSNNKWKEFASLMAASLVDKLLNDPYIFQDWPRLNVGITSFFSFYRDTLNFFSSCDVFSYVLQVKAAYSICNSPQIRNLNPLS